MPWQMACPEIATQRGVIMQQAIVIAPKAILYESVIMKNHCLVAQNVSDELLSGWLLTVTEYQGDFLKIITHYGYTGWIKAKDVHRISEEEYGLWNIRSGSLLLLTQRLTDVLSFPKVQAPVNTTLFMGSTVIPLGGRKDGWQKVRLADNTTGYVPAIALTASPSAATSQTELRSCIINYALSYLGTQYRWGGKTHEGIDCSGLTFMSYFMCGILIYRDASIQKGYPVREIPRSQIKPADLLYFPGHIALYLGNDKYIHATGNLNSYGCVINSLDSRDMDYRADLAESLYAVGSVFC